MDDVIEIEVEAEHVAIYHEGEQVVYWDRQEWLDDPDILVSIVNCIKIATEQGGEAIREKLYDDYGFLPGDG